MKTILACFLVLSSLFSAFGQRKVKVVNGDDYQPIGGVQLFGFVDQREVLCAISDDSGLFTFLETALHLRLKEKVVLKHPSFEILEDSLLQDKDQLFLLFKKQSSIDEVVVTAQINPVNHENSIQKVTLISREQIDAKGATNLKDVLQNEMNIRIIQDQVLGAGLSLKGMGGEGVKILIDGVPVVGRNDGNIDLSQINLATIERIEIIEGPLSVNYGSNAIAGTINLITKKVKKSGQLVQLNSLYETSGHYNVNLSYDLTKGKHSFTFSGGRNFFDGWKDGDPFIEFPKEKIADSSRFQTWKPKEQLVIGARYSLNLKKWQLNPFVDVFKETITNRGYPRPPYQIYAFDDKYQTTRMNSGLHFTGKINRTIQLKGQMGYNQYDRVKNTFVTDLTTLDQQLSANSSDQDTSRFELKFARLSCSNYSPLSKYNYEIGYELNHELGVGSRILNKKQQIVDQALFSTLEYRPIEQLVLNPGVRLNHNSVYGFVAVPSFNVKFQHKKITLRGNYAQGFRTPSIKELYLEFVDINHNIVGNKELIAEKSNHFQLWIQRKDTFQNKVLSIELNPYYQFIRNKINLAQVVGTTEYTYFNVDVFKAIGCQFNTTFKAKNITLKGGISYLGIGTNYTNKKFYFTPEITGSMYYNLFESNWNLNVFYKYTGTVSSFIVLEDASIEQQFMSDYHLLDLQINYQFWKKKCQFSFGARNLTNVKNISTISGGNSTAHSGGTSSPIAVGRTFYTSFIFTLSTKK